MNKKGFTLIELLIVISILGIISTIILPKFVYKELNLLNSSKLLCNDIRKIRFLMMTEGGQYRIVLGENYYNILNGTKIVKKVKLKDIKIVDNFIGHQIRFAYSGAPSGQGGTVKLVDSKNSYIKITIVPSTGRVQLIDRVFEGYNGNL